MYLSDKARALLSNNSENVPKTMAYVCPLIHIYLTNKLILFKLLEFSPYAVE